MAFLLSLRRSFSGLAFGPPLSAVCLWDVPSCRVPTGTTPTACVENLKTYIVHPPRPRSLGGVELPSPTEVSIYAYLVEHKGKKIYPQSFLPEIAKAGVEVRCFSSTKEAQKAIIDDGSSWCQTSPPQSILTLAGSTNEYEDLMTKVKELNHFGILLHISAGRRLKSKAPEKAGWNDVVGKKT